VRDLVVTMLEETGWRVEVASGGRPGRERVRQTRYDLIVCDMRMPDGSGDGLYRDVVADDPALGKSFLFITGDTANPEAWRFVREAGVPVIAKPFTPTAFMDAVRRVVVSLTVAASRA
jgi:CheY-like chemotaxis protein